MSRILDRINSPADLKPLTLDELRQVAEEVRGQIIETVSRTGGHLAANLGAVELTVALLRAFDPPKDRIVWDVSHQTYAYKILTGRRDRFHTLRQHGGISGFSSREESPYDAFGAGHSGTALSAALGMAAARDRLGGQEHVVAVVGDGALGCGLSFEALNNLATTTRRLIVILNDNEMSISANVGALSFYLGRLLASPRYNRWKSSVENIVPRRVKTDPIRRAYYRLEEAVKSLFLRSMLFEEFGLRYIGPIDGHDIRALLSALDIARNSSQPILLHMWTRKGKGYAPAEAEPDVWHGTSAFDINSGESLSSRSGPSYSEVFGRTLIRLAEQDSRVVAITAAMRAGTGLTPYAEKFPDRFFDVGISEEHAVVFAAGLAAQGLRPVVAVYSTFSQRVVDYVIHDVCLQRLPVVLCLDRAGVVGDDGPTHHGIFDVALLRTVPNLVIMQPKDEAELARMLYTALKIEGPAVIRYPRGAGPGAAVPEVLDELPVGTAEVVREGREVQIWALGDMLPLALNVAENLAAEGVAAGVVNPRFVRPLDEALLSAQAGAARVFVTVENAVAAGGFGSAVEEFLIGRGYRGRILRFGWPDNRFVPHGSKDRLMQEFGLTAEHVREAVEKTLRG